MSKEALFRTVFLNVRKERTACVWCDTPDRTTRHRRTTAKTFNSLLKQKDYLPKIRHFVIDIDTKDPPAVSFAQLKSLVKAASALTIRIDGVVNFDRDSRAPEIIPFDVLERFFQCFLLVKGIASLQSLKYHISEDLWLPYFQKEWHIKLSTIGAQLKDLTSNTLLFLYPPSLTSLVVIHDDPDEIYFDGFFAETWSPILSLKHLVKLVLNPPPWVPQDDQSDKPIDIGNTKLKTLLINNCGGWPETTRVASLFLQACDELSNFTWLNAPFPLDDPTQTNSSDSQSLRFCLPPSLVYLQVSGTEELNNDTLDRINVGDLVKAVLPLSKLVHLVIDKMRFRLYKSPLKIAHVFARFTTIRTLTILGFGNQDKLQQQLSDEFEQLSSTLSWRDNYHLDISCDMIRTWMNGMG